MKFKVMFGTESHNYGSICLGCHITVDGCPITDLLDCEESYNVGSHKRWFIGVVDLPYGSKVDFKAYKEEGQKKEEKINQFVVGKMEDYNGFIFNGKQCGYIRAI